jgi:2'-5' RNA ligase
MAAIWLDNSAEISDPAAMARLFIAINCNDETKNLLLSVQDKIKAQAVKGNFSRPENLHLTLVFLGETPEDQIQAICSAIGEAMRPPVAPFMLAFSQTGCFRHSNKELWWIGAEHAAPSLDTLKNLRKRITGGLSSAGVAFDNRPFNPHITLGREIKHNAPIVLPGQEINFPVNRISLMKSERSGGALVYTEVFGQDL